MALKNLNIFFVFAYFNFFFDCFLGIVSCALRVSKASTAALIFLPRLDYCIFGRALEKVDSGFISYVSFIHMECLHTHPVLVYYCSLVNERIDKREQYLKSNKREMRNVEMYSYTRRHRAQFRWWLAVTLIRNIQLVQSRKHQITHLQLPSAESFNEFLGRKVFSRFQTAGPKALMSRSQGNLDKELSDSNLVIRHPTTACTTLLLDADEQDERFSKNFSWREKRRRMARSSSPPVFQYSANVCSTRTVASDRFKEEKTKHVFSIAVFKFQSSFFQLLLVAFPKQY